jgi:hypothetical protein
MLPKIGCPRPEGAWRSDTHGFLDPPPRSAQTGQGHTQDETNFESVEILSYPTQHVLRESRTGGCSRQLRQRPIFSLGFRPPSCELGLVRCPAQTRPAGDFSGRSTCLGIGSFGSPGRVEGQAMWRPASSMAGLDCWEPTALNACHVTDSSSPRSAPQTWPWSQRWPTLAAFLVPCSRLLRTQARGLGTSAPLSVPVLSTPPNQPLIVSSGLIMEMTTRSRLSRKGGGGGRSCADIAP